MDCFAYGHSILSFVEKLSFSIKLPLHFYKRSVDYMFRSINRLFYSLDLCIYSFINFTISIIVILRKNLENR